MIHHMAFFLAGKLKTGPRPIHEPYFGVKTGSRLVHVQFLLFFGSRPLDDPIFHVYRTWIGFIDVQCALFYHAYAQCSLNEVDSIIRNTDIFYLNELSLLSTPGQDLVAKLCKKLFDAHLDLTDALETVEEMSTNKDISDDETKQLMADTMDMQITLARINHLLGFDTSAIKLLSTAIDSSLQSRDLPDYHDAMLHFQLATFYEDNRFCKVNGSIAKGARSKSG
jgi:hypothetical protein